MSIEKEAAGKIAGAIIVNAFSRDEEYLYQAKRIQQELLNLNVKADIITNDSYLAIIDDDNIVTKFDSYDFYVYFDKDEYVLSMLEKSGAKVFNGCSAIAKCNDKMTTYIELANNGFRLLKTIPGLLCYRENEPIKESSVEFVETLGYPLVAKKSYGSLGEGVYLVRNRAELVGIMTDMKCMSHLFQEYVATSYGKDLRVIVIGDKAIGGMLRKSDVDFRSNIGSGGYGEPYPLTKEIESLSVRIAKSLDLVYCGIDFLFGEDELIVCEVNSNAFFSSFEKVTGINVARKYAEFILGEVTKPTNIQTDAKQIINTSKKKRQLREQ